ncbi:MAG: PD-(D/E)XK nuclease family protein, partial [Bacteroidales bacterium]|nr:PD-(D/E)XK nuclease family protein [Bacteroidales bacterium]
MKYFLQRIAESLYSQYGKGLNTHCLVFPNRRAGLFFRKYLADVIDKPVWSPSVMTINDLFHSLSSLQLAENEMLLFELYKVYRKVRQSRESFDDFYFWGDMLLNDFDDIDKYLVDASKLFRNVKDIKRIDELFGGLTPEQASIVKRFWLNTDIERLTHQKSEFLNVWSILDELFNEFKRVLKEKNLAYEGLIFRDVTEKQRENDASGITRDMVHFIGFNALNTCEKDIMLRLKKEGRAKFYWDYDNSYIHGSSLNSAGFFLRDNITLFGNDMPDDWNYDTLLSANLSVTDKLIINTSSDIAQVKLIPELTGRLEGLTPENAHETAVILADENLLIPLLTSLPEHLTDINITMGYPLKQTSVYLLVKQIIDLQLNARIENDIVFFNHRDVVKILKNSLILRLEKMQGSEIINDIIDKNLL